MHDLVEHAPVVCANRRKVNVCEKKLLGISAAVTALPQFSMRKPRVKSIA